MDTSILLARLIGPSFVVVGIGILINRAYYAELASAVVADKGLYYFSGIIALVVGIAMVQFHNIWVADWRVAITVMGWMSVVKGATRVLFPAVGVQFIDRFARSTWALPITVVFLTMVGLWLCFEGFRR